MAGYLSSLIDTESGGNWGAQNSEIGAGGKPGHFGRVQFGQARLQDAMNAGAIPRGVTPQQFMASPELQMAAEKWHFADLEKNLGGLVGSVVNGQTLDMGALVAMGHLGGAGGAKKYVQTGGRYDPSDSFGTSLSDYAGTHGGQSSGRDHTTLAGGTGDDTMNAQPSAPQGLLGKIARTDEQVGGLLGMMFKNMTPERADTIRASLAGITGNQGQLAAATGRMDGRRDASAADLRMRQQEAMRKAGLIESRNDPLYQARLAQANLNLEQDRSGAVSATSATGNLLAQAAAAGLVEGTPEFEEFMLNGGGDPASYRALRKQAEDAGFAYGTPEYQNFMATRGAGLRAGAKTLAENLADTETGGEAAYAVEEGTLRAKADLGREVAKESAIGAAQGKQDVGSGSEVAEMQRNMPGLLEVAETLNKLADTATYTKGGTFIDEVRKQMGMDPDEGAVARAEYIAVVDNQVLPLLRQTFGAAFTAKEGETLRATLGDPDKSPAEKKAVLNAFIQQKERDLIARGGTVPNRVDTPPVTTKRLRFNPETGKLE